MVQNTPEIAFIDTTLREGYQSAVKLFPENVAPVAYAKAVMANLYTSYLEIYGPTIYYTAGDYESLVETLGSRLQLYCGTVDKFDPDQKQHISDLLTPRLSLTVVIKDLATITKIQQILDRYPSATLRLGLECAGSTNQALLSKFLLQLTNLKRIDTIVLSDSNGTMTPDDVRRIVISLLRPLDATIGFHLHNDRGLASANAISAIEACAELGQKRISFDYTYGGLGERYGLLSLQEIIAFGQHIVKSDLYQTIDAFSKLFTNEALRFHSLPYMKKVVHVATSHYDANGKLRPEYHQSFKNRSSNGQ